MKKAIRFKLIGVVLLSATLAAVAVPRILVYMEGQQEPILAERIREVREASYLLVIARRPEKVFESDSLPHRNSPIALYSREGNQWVKEAGDLMCRSTTTNLRPPEPKEIPTTGSKKRMFGHQSVPTGVYTLTEDVWKDGWNRCFLISDWGRTDGSIVLSEPQVLRYATLVRDKNHVPSVEVGEVERTTLEKRGSYLHPTITRYWSYHDSNGCINLYGSSEEGHGETYDWDRFLSWLDKRGIDPHVPNELPLVIGDEDLLIDPESNELQQELPIDFYKDIP